MTRVRLIDFETNNVRVVYDHFFKPPSPTMDYLVSQLMVIRAPPVFLAITPHLRALVTPTTVQLCRTYAHSHPRYIDTALIFHRPCGRPPKPGLARLTRGWLGCTIQDRRSGGHDPEKHARPCADY